MGVKTEPMWNKVVFWLCSTLGLAAARSSPYSYHLPHSSVTFIMGPQALQHPILSNHLEAAKLSPMHGKLRQHFKSSQSSTPNSVHPIAAVPEVLLGHSRDRAPSLQAAPTAVQLFATVQDDENVEQAEKHQSVHHQPVQHVQHQKPITFFHSGTEAQMSGKEGKASEEDREGRMVEATKREKQSVVQMLKPSENNKSDRISSDVSTSEKQSVENSEFSESVKEMTIYSGDGMENAVVPNQTDGSIESSSKIIKPADSGKKNRRKQEPNKDHLEERLASLQRQLDATLRQLASSKSVEPTALLRGGQLFEEGKRGLIRLEPGTLLRGKKLSMEEELEANTLDGRSNVLTDGEGSRRTKDTTGEDGRGAMVVTQTNSVQEEPVRYFY